MIVARKRGEMAYKQSFVFFNKVQSGIVKSEAMPYALKRHLRRAIVLSQQIRLKTTTANMLTQDDFVFRPPLAQWSKVVKEAEKIVGYPNSCMNLRWLSSDVFNDLSVHLHNVVDSKNLVEMVMTFLHNEHNNIQPWSLVILLLSKAITAENPAKQTNKVIENQRVLAELTEMIRTGHNVHRGIQNIPLSEQDKSNTAMFDNKIAILTGDYLFAIVSGMLERLKNQELLYLITIGSRDLVEGEFYGQTDGQNLPIPGKPADKNGDQYLISSDTLPLEVLNTLGQPVREWTLRNMYGGGSLFGRACQGAALLAGLGQEEQDNAYKFGCHLCLAWQATTEYQKITSETKVCLSLVSAPVLFALSDNPELYNVIQNSQNISDIDFGQLKIDILKTDAVEQTRLLYVENANKARNYVETFGNSQPIDTIKRLIKSL